MKYVRPLLALTILSSALGSLGAQPINGNFLRNGANVKEAFREVVARPSESVVTVKDGAKLDDKTKLAFGTIVGADGWILTKWDEIRGHTRIVCILKDGTQCEANVVGVQEEYDLALLKIDASNLVPVEWRDSKETKVGKWVASVGPSAKPIAIGVVSVATRPYKEGDQPPKKSINPKAGYLGVQLDDSPMNAKVTIVVPKSPADKAGVKPNDIVVEAGGLKIPDKETLIKTIQRLKAGDTIVLKIKRGEEDLELEAKLDKLPKGMLGNPQETMGSTLSNRRGGFPWILQHDTILEPNECGGPLIDLDGKAVGINISRAGRTESYAIPSEKIQSLLPELKSGKLVPVIEENDPVLKVSAKLTRKDMVDKHRDKGQFMKVHEVTLKGGVSYAIEMKSFDFDSFLIVEDSSGKKVAEDDDTGGNQNAKILFEAPQDGVYRIVATTFDPNEVGSYTLTVRRHFGPLPKKKQKN